MEFLQHSTYQIVCLILLIVFVVISVIGMYASNIASAIVNIIQSFRSVKAALKDNETIGAPVGTAPMCQNISILLIDDGKVLDINTVPVTLNNGLESSFAIGSIFLKALNKEGQPYSLEIYNRNKPSNSVSGDAPYLQMSSLPNMQSYGHKVFSISILYLQSFKFAATCILKHRPLGNAFVFQQLIMPEYESNSPHRSSNAPTPTAEHFLN